MLNKIVIDYNALNLASISPMVLLIAFALFIIGISIFAKELSGKFYTVFVVLAIFLDIGVLLGYNGGINGFFNIMLIDGIAILSMFIVLISSIFFIFLMFSGKIFHEQNMPEFFALFLFMLAGYEFMVSSGNLILIFIGLETSSLALYALIAMHNTNFSVEAAIKYFTMGALGSGFFVLGAAVFYLMTGSVEISTIVGVIKSSESQNTVALAGASMLMLVSIGFKLSFIPFHTWVPDVYEGSTAALAGFMSIVPKIAGFVVALRLFEVLINSEVWWIRTVLYVIAVLTMTLSNIMALVQSDVKRMLAFSSISHAGFVLCAIVIGSTQANISMFLYWIMLSFANLGAFSVLWLTRAKKNIWHERYHHPFTKFKGLIKIKPSIAVIMAVFMFSLAGIPPFSVFWGKMYLMSAAVNGKFFILAVIMALNSAIAVYYYLKLVVFMFLYEPFLKDEKIYLINSSTPLKSIITIAFLLCVASSFIVKFILPIIYNYVVISEF